MLNNLISILISPTTSFIIDLTILLSAAVLATSGNIGMGIAGIAIYLIGTHPRYYRSKSDS